MGDKTAFCRACRKKTGFVLERKPVKKIIRGKEYTFSITGARCAVCGAAVSPHGLPDLNIREVDAAYRSAEGIVTVDEIKKLLLLYKLGRSPLSLALGFGEATLARYLAGQLPDKACSRVLRRALEDPRYFAAKLEENKARLSHAAYARAMKTAEKLEQIFAASGRLLGAASYLLRSCRGIGPCALSKLLYYAEGLSLALKGRVIFTENCSFSRQGPVYPVIRELLADFGHEILSDARFGLLKGEEQSLPDGVREILSLVAASFGMYSDKALSEITAKEAPCLVSAGATAPAADGGVISKRSMQKYFRAVHNEYGLGSVEKINSYIAGMLAD